MDYYYTLDMDGDNLNLLFDVLAAAIALAEGDENTARSRQATRLVSVGMPLLSDLRDAHAAQPPRSPTPLQEIPRLLPTCRRRRLASSQ